MNNKIIYVQNLKIVYNMLYYTSSPVLCKPKEEYTDVHSDMKKWRLNFYGHIKRTEPSRARVALI